MIGRTPPSGALRPKRAGRRPHSSLAIAVALLALAACAPLVTTPPPTGVREIAVLPVHDVYGDGLPIRWASISGLLGERPPAPTVPGLLAAELQSQLAARGFAVADAARVHEETDGAVPTSAADAARIARAAHIASPVTYAKLSRWEADPGVSPSFIAVRLELSLVDPTTSALLWSADWPTRPVPTGGSGSYAVAAERAAQEVVARMIEGLAPGAKPATTP